MRHISLLIIGIILTNYLVSSTKDCGPCPSVCPFGNTFTKKNDMCTCSCAEDPCKKKNCPKKCRVEDKSICRAGNCLQLKVGVCYEEDENPIPQIQKPVDSVPKTSVDSGYLEGQLRIVPSRIELHEGDRTDIKCELHDPITDSTKPVRTTWSRDNAGIGRGGGSNTLPAHFQVNGNVLRIENARESDSGTYRCTGASRYETVHETVEVRVLPRQRQQQHSHYYQPSTTRTTTTTTKPTPQRMPNQERDNMVLLKNLRPLYSQYNPYQQQPANSRATYGNQNYYDTDVRVYDNNNSPFVFTAELPEFPDASIIPEIELVGPKEVKVNEGGSAVVEFRVFNGGGTLRIGKYDDILPPGSKVEVRGDNYKLYLSNLRRSDKGYYTCTVTNKYGASERKAVMVHVGGCRPAKKTPTPAPEMLAPADDIPAPAPAPAPVYYNPPPPPRPSRPTLVNRAWPRAYIVKLTDNALEATEGESITIECNVLNADQSYFSKLEDRISVDNLVRREGNILYLELKNLRESDSATYECMAENQEGTAIDKIKLRVKPKEKGQDSELLPRASVIKTEDIKVLNQGDSFVIECAVERSNDVELSKSGAPMPKSYKKTFENNVYKLNLFDLQPSDSGYFYCIATNEYGADRCWIYLDIRPRDAKYRVERPPAQQQQPSQSREEPRRQQPQQPKPVTESAAFTTTSTPIGNDIASSGGSLMVKINDTLPRLQSDTLELNLIEGESVILECKVSNGRITNFKKYENEPMKYVHERFNGYERLIISELNIADAGYYVCEAANDSDLNRDQLLLNVQKREE